MGVRKGYKLTEVGEIPEDWIRASLKELASRKSNAIVGGPFGSDLTAKDYTTVGIPVIRGQNMGRKYISGDSVFVSEGKAKALSANTATKNDLVFTQRGTLGQVSIVPQGKNKAYLISQSQMKITLDEEKANSCYVYYYFISTYGQKQITTSAIQTGVPHTNLGLLKQYLVPLPVSIIEQSAIAAALGDADSLIDSLEALIEKKRLIKRGAMEELLTGKIRLPEVSGNLATMPIKEIANVKTGPFGSTLHERDYVNDGVPIITVEHLGEFGVSHQALPMVSELDRKRLEMYSLQEGDIVFSRVGSVDRNALIRTEEDGWLFSGRLLRVRPHQTFVDSRYLSCLFHSRSFLAEVFAVAVGQTMASLSTKILNEIEITLPTRAEQSAIAQVLSDMDAEIEALEAKLEKARAIKRGMMEELLTGRIRLV